MDNQKVSKSAEKFFEICSNLKGKKVGIFGHLRPDADSLGSQMGMYSILKSLKADPVLVSEDFRIADNLRWILNGMSFTDPNTLSLDEFVFVDCGTMSRSGEYVKKIVMPPILMVDHHISGEKFAQNNFQYFDAAATCEILSEFIIGEKFFIPPEIANALYAGLVTDTGKFSYSMTTAKTLRIAADLIEMGAQPSAIFQKIYQNESREKIALLKRFLETLKFYLDGKVCVGVVTEEDYSATGTTSDDTSSLVNYPREIRGVKVAVLVYDRDGKTRVSLRTENPSLRLDKLAAKFHGGGHACAAAFSMNSPYEKFEKVLINALQEHLNSFTQ